MTSVGIIGGSGFTGAELLRICAGHPQFDVAFATADTRAGVAVRELYPSLTAAYPELVFVPFEPSLVDGIDLVFLGLPHGASQQVVPDLIGKVRLVDLAADFRLRDAAAYPAWYGEEHQAADLLDSFVYGLPELFRHDLVGAESVAVPGCFPTTAALALAPLFASGIAERSGVIVDAASGVSGAGRALKPNTAFCAVDEDFTAYGLLDHRHTPEIEQSLSRVAADAVHVLFTPHLAPMNRGILATCYARPIADASTAELLALYRSHYRDEPFVVVTDSSPSTKATLGSNTVHVTVRRDPRTGWIIAIAALDNLVKGASGQAVQCANVITGLDETAGLTAIGLYP